MKLVVLIVLAAILVSLGSGLWFLARDDQGSTRVLTTAIVLETGKGNFDIAIALGLLLLLITFLVNWALTWIQQRSAK